MKIQSGWKDPWINSEGNSRSPVNLSWSNVTVHCPSLLWQYDLQIISTVGLDLFLSAKEFDGCHCIILFTIQVPVVSVPSRMSIALRIALNDKEQKIIGVYVGRGTFATPPHGPRILRASWMSPRHDRYTLGVNITQRFRTSNKW